jgi:hypothetical protein
VGWICLQALVSILARPGSRQQLWIDFFGNWGRCYYFHKRGLVEAINRGLLLGKFNTMRYIITLIISILSLSASSQTLVFHENFEAPSNADSLLSTGSFGWGISQAYAAGGIQSDSGRVAPADSCFLTSITFSTTGYNHVALSFDQICKIDMFDAAYVEVSNNNGLSWIRLTNADYYGQGTFSLNYFNSLSYFKWEPASPGAVPGSDWWRSEYFDLSSYLANSANCRIRFAIKDQNLNGMNNSYAWLINNVLVKASNSELIPPLVQFAPPLLPDTIYNTGPFTVTAIASDASGIGGLKLVYSLDSLNADTIAMTVSGPGTYTAEIPSFTYNTSVYYKVVATDSSGNMGSTPGNGFHKLRILQPPHYAYCGTANSTTNLAPVYITTTTSSNKYSNHIAIYTPSEINYQGLIRSIAWNKADNIAYLGNDATFKVYLKHTSLNSVPTGAGTFATETASAIMVYSSTTQNIPGMIGWFELMLQTQFNYNGTSNLMVMVDFYRPQAASANNPMWYYSTETGKSLTWQGTSPNPGTTAGSGLRPHLRLGFTPNPFALDAGIRSLNSPSGVVLANTSYPVQVVVNNFGTNTITTLSVGWSLDNIVQIPYSFAGSYLLDVVNPALTLGSINLQQGFHTLKIWTATPNGQSDQNTANDTLIFNFYACPGVLSGTYTLGGSGADFSDFNHLALTLSNCGVSGPVTVNISPGTYNQRFELGPIPGSSPVNTITLQGSTSNAANVVLSYNALSAAENAIIKLSGISNLKVKHLTLQALSSSFSTTLHYSGACSAVTFEQVHFKAPASLSTDINLSLVYSPEGSNSNDSLISFLQCHFENGSFGLNIFGPNSSNSEYGSIIMGNTFTNQYSTAIHAYNQRALLIKDNLITNINAAIYYGIRVGYSTDTIKVLANKISSLNSNGYGINLYYCSGQASLPGLVANNFISMGGTGNTNGIFTQSSSHQHIIYNSINVVGTSATLSRAMYVGNGSSDIVLKNNSIANNGAGWGLYAIATTTFSSDYNNIFTVGSSFAFHGSNTSNLAQWISTSGKDANSVSVNPDYTSITNLHTLKFELNGKAIPYPAVSSDIDGQIRNPLTPDIGADEFQPTMRDAAVLAILSPSGGCAIAQVDTVRIQVKNFGADTILSFSAGYRINNQAFVTKAFTDTLLPFASKTYKFDGPAGNLQIGNNLITAFTALPLDENTGNDTISTIVENGYDLELNRYQMGFEASSGVQGWTVYDANQDNFGWAVTYTSTTYANTGSGSARLRNGTANVSDDWLFSRCFILESGKKYRLSYHYRAESANYAQNISVHLGNDKAATAMTTLLKTHYGFTNTTYIKSVITFEVAQTGVYYFGWWGTSPAVSWYAYIDDMNLEELKPIDAGVMYFSNPVSACGLSSTEVVSIAIANLGLDTIDSGLQAAYILGNGPAVVENVSGILLPGDTMLFNFSQTVNLAVSGSNQTYALKAYTQHAADSLHRFNDTLVTSIVSYYLPAAPSASGSTINSGQSAQLTAISPLQLFWYDAAFGGNLLSSGSSFTTPVLFKTDTFWVGAMSLNSCHGPRTMVIVNVIVPPLDAGIQSIVSPGTMMPHGTATAVKALVENFGSDTINSFRLISRLGSAATDSVDWVGQLLPGMQLELSVDTLTLSYGNYQLCVEVIMTGDTIPANDELCKSVQVMRIDNLPWNSNFDTDSVWSASSAPGTAWQHGIPTYGALSSPYSAPFAWKTNKDTLYRPDASTTLYTQGFNFQGVSNAELSFMFNYITEADYDGFVLEYTLDNQQWSVLGMVNDPVATNWYNTSAISSLQKSGWSGNSGGWLKATYNLNAFNAEPFVRFRFVFASDPSVEYEGAVIDNFAIQVPPPLDAGISAILEPSQAAAQGSQVSLKVLLRNYGSMNISSLNIGYRLNSGTVISQPWSGSLMPNMSDTVSLGSILLPQGFGSVCVFSSLIGDGNGQNDTLCKAVYGIPPVDIGVTELLSPSGVSCFNANQTVILRLKNFGTAALNFANNPLTVNASVSGPIPAIFNPLVINSGSLSAGATMDVTVAANCNMSASGIYTFTAALTLTGDGNALNDNLIPTNVDANATISVFPHMENFESFVTGSPGIFRNGWSIIPISGYRWQVNSSHTSTANTGPSVDHTLGATGGKYVYAESSSGSSGHIAGIISNCMDISTLNNPKLAFWYFMYGSDVDTLYVDVRHNGIWFEGIWKKGKQQQLSSTAAWLSDTINLSSYPGIINIRFRARKGGGFQGDIAIDDVSVFGTIQNDASVSGIVSPQVSYAPQGTQHIVGIQVQNNGLNSITQLNLGYRIGNQPIVSQTWNGNLSPGASISLIFNLAMTLPAGELVLKTWVQLSNDQNVLNDTLSRVLFGLPVINGSYFDDFEGSNTFYAEGTFNLWQRAVPQGAIFNLAYSPPRAWVTNPTGFYQNGSNEYLYTPYFDFTNTSNAILRFRQRYQSEQNYDGMTLQYSVYGTNQWVTLGYIGIAQGSNWYNSVINGVHCWSGSSGPWVQAAYDLSQFNQQAVKVQFRFRLFSNESNSNFEGWMIDNFEVFMPSPTYDVGIIDILLPDTGSQAGTSVMPRVVMRNFGDSAVSNIPLGFSVNGTPYLMEYHPGTLAKNQVDTFNFSTAILVPDTNYQFCAYSALVSDQNHMNDSLCRGIEPARTGIDLRIDSIPLPVYHLASPNNYQVVVSNIGTLPVDSILFRAKIGLNTFTNAQWTGLLLPGNSLTYQSTTPIPGVSASNSTITIEALVNMDENPLDNVMIKATQLGTGIKEEGAEQHLTLVPNPAREYVDLVFEGPAEFDGIVRLLDISGRTVYSGNVRLDSGSKVIRLGLSSCVPGTYLVRLENEKAVSVHRLVIAY